MKKVIQNRYVVRKYIMANSALEAIRRDKKAPVHDVWIDEDWKKTKNGVSAIGFMGNKNEFEDE